MKASFPRSVSLGFVVAAAFLGACGKEKAKSPEGAAPPSTLTTLDKPGETITPQDQKELKLLVEHGEPVLLVTIVSPSKYGRSLEKLKQLEKEGKLRVEFNPNNSEAEADVAPLLAVRFTAEYLASTDPSELFSEFGFESVSIDRVRRVPRPHSRREVAGPGRMPLDAIGARTLGNLGKGIKIAVIDTGLEISHPALQRTVSGDAKIIDFKDFTREGRFRLQGVETAPECDGRFEAFAEAAKKAVASETAEVLVACVEESRAVDGQESTVDINADGNTEGDFSAVAFLNKDGAKVALDINRNGLLDKGELVTAWKRGAPFEPSLVVTGSGIKRDLRRLLVQIEPRLGGGYELELGFDQEAHGTHVGGIIAGHMGAGGAFDGVAPEAQLLGYKVCSSTGCPLSAIYGAMIEAAKEGAHIANLSLGGSESLKEDAVAPRLVRFLTQKYGTLFVLAAGNEGPSLNTSGDPGNFPQVLTVGAWNPKQSWNENHGFDLPDSLYWWSSRGPTRAGGLKPEVIAPGGIVSSVPYTTAKSGFEHFQGTSMAAPMVSGLAALVLEAAQAKSLKLVSKDRSPGERALALKRAIEEGAKPQDGLAPFEQGYGLASAPDAVAKLSEWDALAQPGRPLFRYLKVSGDFFEATGSDLQARSIAIETLSDPNLSERREDYDASEEWSVETSADWIELLDSSRRAVRSAPIRPGTLVTSVPYRIKPTTETMSGVRSAFIDVKDAKGLRHARLLVTDIHAEELVSAPQLLEDARTEVSYRLRKENVTVPAGQNVRFFVRVPRGATGLGVRAEAVGEALVVATISGHGKVLAQEFPFLHVRQEGSKLVRRQITNQVAVSTEKPGLYEVVLTGHESVKTSTVHLEIRASGLSAPTQAFIAPKGGPVVAANVLGSSKDKPNVRTTPWFRIEPIGVDLKKPKPLTLTTGSTVYLPLPPKLLRFNVNVKPESEDSYLAGSFMDSDYRIVKSETGPDGFLVFAEAPAFLALNAVYLENLKEKILVSLAIPVAEAPAVKVAAGPAPEAWAAQIAGSQQAASVFTTLLWSDPYLGPQPIQKTQIIGAAEKGPEATASTKARLPKPLFIERVRRRR